MLQPQTEIGHKSKKTNIGRILISVSLMIAIFALGFAFGSGRVGFRVLKGENKSLPKNLDYSSVEQVYDILKRNYDGKLDVNKLLDGLKHGLVQATGDPYTDYFSAKEAKDFNNQLNGTFQGIGAELGKDTSGNLIIVSPIAGFPAQKAGLKPNDIISEINGKSTSSLSVDKAVSLIRGPQGSKVTLKIVRSKGQSLTVTITRAEIKVPSVKYKILDSHIGYMQITEFSRDTSELANKAAQSFKQAHVNGVILDLRGNPGGELDAAVSVSSLWLKPNQTVLTERRDGKIIQTYKAQGNALLSGLPTVVLIDKGSASASEITAGALHDNNVATLLGLKSFGKGSVQQIDNLRDGAEIKVTIARWFTPNGKNIDKQGIKPDKVVERTSQDLKLQKDPQLEAALKFIEK